MIRYELRCPAEHGFEGWFKSSGAYDDQRLAGEVACPVCGSADISKAPMAPAVAKSGGDIRPALDPMTMLRAMRRAVEANCENVGAKFAEEARKIHNGEADERGIYGSSTPAEAEALADDGIEIATIPWVPATDG